MTADQPTPCLDVTHLLHCPCGGAPATNVHRLPCPTCSGPIRETVGMVCQTCGTDYGAVGVRKSARNPDAADQPTPERAGRPTLTIPVPVVAPFGSLLDKPEYVQEVWDAFVKPDQEALIPPCIEMRLLMAILRAVYEGLSSDLEAPRG